ncbi:MAG: VOC family protein [Verrucomicrobia bacterium]|nr:VOC family protein [Verrucomicrobiota bacterium]
MQKITPFLWFNDNAEEAVRFYLSIFKQGKLGRITRYGENAPGPAGSVMTVPFKLFGQDFVALNGGPVFQFNESISFVVNCTTQREVDTYWRKLAAGGGRTSQCGWLKDKFGVSWQIVPVRLIELVSSKDAAQAGRVMQAMLTMTKIDLKRLEKAAKG